MIKSAAILLPWRIISQQFVRALKTRVPTPFSCKRFNRPIAISRGTLASVRFDSAPLPWRAKRKRGAQLSVGSADRTDLQRPYLNYSEKLISFFLPSTPRKPFERFRVWRGPRVQGESRNENDRPIAPPPERTGRVIRWTLPFVPLIILSPRKAKRNTHVRARTQVRRVPYVLISFFDVLSFCVLSGFHRCVRQVEYFCITYTKFFWNIFKSFNFININIEYFINININA